MISLHYIYHNINAKPENENSRIRYSNSSDTISILGITVETINTKQANDVSYLEGKHSNNCNS